jgi:asparagine synthase (glutamine-hydrolysing)
LENQVRLAADTLRAHEQCHWLTFILFKQNPWHHNGRMSLEESQVAMRTPFLDHEFLGLLYQSPNGPDVEGKVSMRLIADGDRKIGGITSDRGYRLHGNPLARAASRWFYETVFRAEYVFDYGMPPWLSKVDRALGKIQLRRFFLGWHKFYHFRTWFQNDLSSYVREVLLDSESRKRPYLVKGSMERLVSEHMTGVRNHTVLINKLITLELIHRLLLEQQGMPTSSHQME